MAPTASSVVLATQISEPLSTGGEQMGASMSRPNTSWLILKKRMQVSTRFDRQCGIEQVLKLMLSMLALFIITHLLRAAIGSFWKAPAAPQRSRHALFPPVGDTSMGLVHECKIWLNPPIR
jgi:hypothetical protein